MVRAAASAVTTFAIAALAPSPLFLLAVPPSRGGVAGTAFLADGAAFWTGGAAFWTVETARWTDGAACVDSVGEA